MDPPFASARRSAAPLEASDRAVELDLAEHGLDGDLARAVNRAPRGRGEPRRMKSQSPPGPARTAAPAQPGVGRHEHLHAVADVRFHLALMPVAGVGHHDLGIREAEHAQFALGGADHWVQVSEVRRLGRDLGGDDDLSIVDRQLRVVALQRRLAMGAHHTRVAIGDVNQPRRGLGRPVGLHHPGRHPTRSVGGNLALAPRLVRRV